jgi:hypothetical protein
MATTTRVVPLATYPSGSRSFGPFATPNGLIGFSVNIGRCTSADPTTWSNASTVVNLFMQFSYDGGVTYTAETANSFTNMTGGIVLARGVELPEQVCSWNFTSTEPQFINGPTHLKGRIEVVNGPIKTYVDVTIP